MGQFETANTINILAGARNPTFLAAGGLTHEFSASPASGTTYPVQGSGVSLGNVLRADIMAVCRETPAYRTIRLTVADFDAVATYSFISGAGTSTVGPFATVELLLAAWAVDITTVLAGVASATAIDTDSDSLADELLIVGLTDADYRADYSTTSGTSTISGRGDAVSFKATVYSQSANQARNAPDNWTALNNMRNVSITVDGMNDIIEVAGLSQIYARVHTIAGFAGDASSLVLSTPVYIAPCKAE